MSESSENHLHVSGASGIRKTGDVPKFESVFRLPDPPRKDVMTEVFEVPMFPGDSDSDSTAITVGGYFAKTLQQIWKQALLHDVDWVVEVTKALCDAGIARDGDHAYDLVAEALEAWEDSHG